MTEGEPPPPPPLFVAHLFRGERASLLALLRDLPAEEWQRDTIGGNWTVKDVTAHLLGVDIGNLSHRRDGYNDPLGAEPAGKGWAELVDFLDGFNQTWVESARRISPRLLCELLATTGEAAADYFGSLDPMAMGGSVSWVGPEPAPVWLDIAREYTERWVHQQQIRDAVERPGLTDVRHFAPVLATFVHALPRALGRAGKPGACLRLTLAGDAGGTWYAVRSPERWLLTTAVQQVVDATVVIDQDTAWRLFTRGLQASEALERVSFEDDRLLGERVLGMVSIIA